LARIRTIKPDFWTNEKVMNCKPLARLLFIGMWNFADDHGRLPFGPKTLKAQIFAGDEMPSTDVRDMLVELSSNGLIMIYTVEDREYIEITGWDHQKIDRRGDAKYPAPFTDGSSNNRRRLAPDLTLSKGKRSEPEARDELQKRTGDFQQAVVQAFASANSPNLPETSRCGLWLSQGYQEDICLAVIAGIVRKKPSVTTLSYFDNAIAEAHAKKAPPRKAVGPPPPMDWDAVLTTYKKVGHWSRDAGPDLESPACRCPPEFLEKHGLKLRGLDA
jgi:hypothetical protein